MNHDLLKLFSSRKARAVKSVAVLIDPDDVNFETLPAFVAACEGSGVHYFFVGGSLITSGNLTATVRLLKSLTDLPVILFPGNHAHITEYADAVLLLSLVSGRNPDFLIGQHVLAAPALKRADIQVLSTAYLLIDGGTETTVSYISNTKPIPNDKPDIAVATVIAAELIGMRLAYLDAGSGAKNPVSSSIIKAVADVVNLPIMVGGGLRSIEAIETAFRQGADVVVIGNALEENPDFAYNLAALMKSTSPQKVV